MAVNKDPQRRPVFIDRVNNRLLADPTIGSTWQVITLVPGMFGDAPANTVLGRAGTSGPLENLTADVQIDLLNTATTQTIDAARVVAGSTSAAGVLQLTDSTSSTSTTTAATPNSVKTAYDLADAALPKTGGTMTGAIMFAAGQTISGYGLLDGAQTWTKGQRGEVTTLTDAATIAVDFSDSNNFEITLAGNRTLGNPTNLVAGQSGCIWITQDGTGSRTLAYDSYWDFSGGTAPTLSTTANAADCLAYSVQSATKITASLISNLS
jgi:hypothetical protein